MYAPVGPRNAAAGTYTHRSNLLGIGRSGNPGPPARAAWWRRASRERARSARHAAAPLHHHKFCTKCGITALGNWTRRRRLAPPRQPGWPRVGRGQPVTANNGQVRAKLDGQTVRPLRGRDTEKNTPCALFMLARSLALTIRRAALCIGVPKSVTRPLPRAHLRDAAARPGPQRLRLRRRHLLIHHCGLSGPRAIRVIPHRAALIFRWAGLAGRRARQVRGPRGLDGALRGWGAQPRRGDRSVAPGEYVIKCRYSYKRARKQL